MAHYDESDQPARVQAQQRGRYQETGSQQRRCVGSLTCMSVHFLGLQVGSIPGEPFIMSGFSLRGC